ncbi:hypothetical protein, partial [Sutterella wadsworthensis]|uniref:hypothetical protein n=3 Tax=Sutterella wadsworthensis TaxID=40545 RepID=UPI003AF8C44E
AATPDPTIMTCFGRFGKSRLLGKTPSAQMKPSRRAKMNLRKLGKILRKKPRCIRLRDRQNKGVNGF